MSDGLDPVLLATLAHRLDSIVREAMQACVQSARSSTLQSRDLSASISDSRVRLVSIAQGLPIHVLTSNMSIAPIPELFDDIAPGDCFLNNSPFLGCAHHADYCFCTPVFHGDKLMFWVMLRAHQADTGASEPSVYLPFAKDVYEEGIHWPCVRVQRGYEDVADVVRIGRANIRVPEQFFGDFAAAVGATRVAERRLTALIEKYGSETIEEFVDEWIDYGSRRMVDEIRSLPQGTWENETRLDPLPFAPEGVSIKIKLTVDHAEEAIIVDLRENPDQFEAGINLTEATAKAGVMEGIFWCLDPTLPHNQGAFDHVRFELREGCVVGIPRFPVGTSVATTFTADRLASCAIALMAKVDPDRGGGEGGYINWGVGVFSGEDHRRGNAPYVDQLIIPGAHAGGGPAIKGYDGWLTWMCGAGQGSSWTTAVELWEKAHPHLIECGARVVPDSGGAGEFRGSPALRIVVRARVNPMVAAGFGDGMAFPPKGVLGGQSGGPSLGFIVDENGEKVRELPLVGIFEVLGGNALEAVTTGGGGLGDPLDRDPERVRLDVRAGWVSIKAAREIYGVALDREPELFAVDLARTQALRRDIRKLGRSVGSGSLPG